MLIPFAGHQKVFSKKIYLSGMKYDIKTTFLSNKWSNISLQCMSRMHFQEPELTCHVAFQDKSGRNP